MTDRTSENQRDSRRAAPPARRKTAVGTLPIPEPTAPFSRQILEVLFAMCLFGEARGETQQARCAIAQLIVNRASFPHPVFGSKAELSFEENLRRVILAPAQFSCFLPG